MDEPAEWLTLAQAATRAEMSRSGFDAAVRRGDVPFAAIGGQRVFAAKDVEAFARRRSEREVETMGESARGRSR
jgi:hypothetical protein